MVEGATLRVDGYRDLMRALALCDRATKREVRNVLRGTGEAVKRDSGALVLTEHAVSPSTAITAAGYRTVVRQRGISVEQKLRKTTGAHPEWGAWQMRHALVPALDENEADTNRRMERALDVIAARFNQAPPLEHD